MSYLLCSNHLDSFGGSSLVVICEIGGTEFFPTPVIPPIRTSLALLYCDAVDPMHGLSRSER